MKIYLKQFDIKAVSLLGRGISTIAYYKAETIGTKFALLFYSSVIILRNESVFIGAISYWIYDFITLLYFNDGREIADVNFFARNPECKHQDNDLLQKLFTKNLQKV